MTLSDDTLGLSVFFEHSELTFKRDLVSAHVLITTLTFTYTGPLQITWPCMAVKDEKLCMWKGGGKFAEFLNICTIREPY